MVLTSSVLPLTGSCRVAAGRSVPAFAAEHEVVVVAAHEVKLLVVCAEALPDGVRAAEVERRALHFGEFAGRNRLGIDRREVLGMNRQLVVQNVARAAREAPERVVRQVENGGLVRLGAEGQAQHRTAEAVGGLTVSVPG